MSMGFLTESTLLPKRAKDIRVSGNSMVALHSIVAQKEQQLNRDEELIETERKQYRRGRQGRVGATKRKREDETNRGVKARAAADQSPSELKPREEQVFAKLLQKSKLYEQLTSEAYDPNMLDEQQVALLRDEAVVDFERKRMTNIENDSRRDSKNSTHLTVADASAYLKQQHKESERRMGYGGHVTSKNFSSSSSTVKHEQPQNHTQSQHHVTQQTEQMASDSNIVNMVEIEDEFGRNRRVPKGSQAYFEYRQRQAYKKLEGTRTQYSPAVSADNRHDHSRENDWNWSSQPGYNCTTKSQQQAAPVYGPSESSQTPMAAPWERRAHANQKEYLKELSQQTHAKRAELSHQNHEQNRHKFDTSSKAEAKKKRASALLDELLDDDA